MNKLFHDLLAGLEKAGNQKNKDVALATIYSMFLSFALTLLVALIIAL